MRFLLGLFFVFLKLGLYGQTTYYLTTSGGSYASEKWVSITTGANGTGTQVWGQGNGTYANGAGLLTDEAIDLSGYEGQTLYLNCYDKYDDTWDGTVYVLEETASGPTVINNNGNSPSDGSDDDSSSSWEGSSSSNHAGELETSEAFTIPSICTEPSTQASNIGFSNVGLNQLDVSWTRGNGDNVIVIAKSGSAPTDPEHGTPYTANTNFGSGSSVGGGFCVYKGSGTSVTVSGLTANTNYYFNVYEFNDTDVCFDLDELSGNETTLAYDSDSDVNAPTTQTASASISSVNNDESSEAIEVFRFKIKDLASGDGSSTNITKVRVKAGNSNNADWTDNIQGAFLKYDGASVTTSSVDITDTYIDFNIVAGNLNIVDGEVNKEASVEIYLNTSNISDGSIIQLKIDADDHGWTTDNNGSAFALDLGTDIISNNFTIEVLATSLSFETQPSDAVVSNAMSPSVAVKAIDVNNNTDIDFTSSIEVTSTGTLSGAPVSVNAISGVATFSSLIHTAVGSNLTLTAERGGTNDWDLTSNTFNVTLVPDECSDAIDILGNNVSVDLTVATQEDVTTNFISMGNGTTFANCNNTGHSAYIHSDFKDLWYKIDIADGADEFTVTISGSSCNVVVIPYTGSCGSLSIMDISGSSSSNTCSGGQAPFINGNGSFRFYDDGQTDIADASTGTIYLRVMGHDNGTDNSNPWCDNQSPCAFTITASSPQANDTDGDAIEIDNSSSNGNLCLAASESESTETGDACASSQDTNDLWYKLTAGGTDPSTYGKIEVTFTNATDQIVVTEFNGAFSNAYESCVTLSSTGAGSTVSHTFLDEINSGNTNYYRVTPLAGNEVCTFTISGQRVAPNNDCSEFESVSTGYNLSSVRNADFNYASASGVILPGGASDTGTKDLYYNFTSNSSTIHSSVTYSGKVDVTLGSISTGTYTIAIYKRNPLYTPCASLTTNLVSYQSGITANGTYTLCTDVTEGDYLVRLIHTSGAEESVTISATPSATSPLNVEGDYLENNTSSAQTTFDLIANNFTGEDFDLDNNGCESTSLSDNGNHITDTGKDLWYTFQTSGAPSCDPTISQLIEGISITLSSSATTGYINLELYTSVSDGGYVAEASIASGNGTATFTGLSASTRYYLRVEENLNLNNSVFNISAGWTNPIPCYDTGATAYDITNQFSNGPCPRDGSLTDYSMKGANAELDGDEDVWFKFTQPSNADEESFTHIRLSNVSTDFYNLEVELYNSVNNLPASKITESPDITSTSVYDEVFINTGNLTPSSVYFIRIVLRESASETDEVKFNLCIFDDNGGHFNMSCPSNTDGNIDLGDAVECDGLAGVDGDCNLTYRINLTPITPSAWYRIEVLANEQIETPQLYGQGNILGDYDNPCNRSGVGNQVVSSGDIASPSTECSGATYGKWVAVNLIGSSSWESNIYNLWIGATAGSGCLGLDLCEVNFLGPFGSQADAEGGDINNINSLYCAYFDYGDLDDGANTYPECYGIYDDENGDSYPDNGVWLGNSIDAENGGVGNANATGDDTGDGNDDEDGLTVLTQGVPGGTAELRVVGNAVAAGTTVHVGLWIDWDGDGFEVSEFYTGSGVSNSPVNIDITVNVPASFANGDEAKVLLKAGKSAFNFGDASGNVLNGEVEGHIISFDNMILPIELVSFKATNEGSYNKISWVTASEKDVDYFVLEKSPNGVDFETVGTLNAAGNSSNMLDYQLIDHAPYPTTYYRLKNMDIDGQFGYSRMEVVDIQENLLDEFAFEMFPNPFQDDNLSLFITNIEEEELNVEIRNVAGQLIFKQDIETSSKTEVRKIHLKNLEAGLYIVTLSNGFNSKSKRLIVQ